MLLTFSTQTILVCQLTLYDVSANFHIPVNNQNQLLPKKLEIDEGENEGEDETHEVEKERELKSEENKRRIQNEEKQSRLPVRMGTKASHRLYQVIIENSQDSKIGLA